MLERLARGVDVARDLRELASDEQVRGRERLARRETLLVEARALPEESATASITERVAELQKSENLDEKDALKRIARERGLSKSDVYRELQRERAKR